jgi:4-carboxymuconolactone decarboxylase
VAEDKIRAVNSWQGSLCFDARERLVLELVDGMTATPAQVPDELYRRLAAEFTPPELVELSATIAWENYRARFNRAFAVAAEGFTEGAVCALPVAPEKKLRAGSK